MNADIECFWYFWDDCAHSPEQNMEIDLSLLLNSSKLAGHPLLRVYEWDRPSASIGYVQNEDAVRNRENYTVVKRPTGGGVVYHDNDFTYSIIVPAEHEILKLNRVESYHIFHRAVAKALSNFGFECILADEDIPSSVNRATMQCFTTPTKYDILCVDSNAPGRRIKVGGSAQRRKKEGILHQGSLDLDKIKVERILLKTAIKKAFEEEFSITFRSQII